MHRRTTTLLIAIGPIFVCPVLAQHKDHSHAGVPVEFDMPKHYREAVAQIELRLHVIAELMETGRLDQIHGHADVIRKMGMVVGMLSLNPNSGVPKEARGEVQQTGKALSAMFEAIDTPADAGDAEGTRKAYDEIVKLTAVLQKYVPKVYSCPMACEGEKTYPAVGACPKCGMALSELKAHADHNPKHGGVFFMAPDQKHHLEGTLTEDREFRIYFYDEFTRPILAEKFTAQGTVWSKNAEETTRTDLVLIHGSAKAFLTGTVDAAIALPIRVKMFIDFHDGEKPQVFDFEFEAPSREPRSEKAG